MKGFGTGAKKSEFQESQAFAVLPDGTEVGGHRVRDWEDPDSYGEMDLVTTRQAAVALGVEFESFSQRVHDCNLRGYGSPFDIRTKPRGRLYARWWEVRKWWKIVGTRKGGYGKLPTWRETRAERFRKVLPLGKLAPILGITTTQLHSRMMYDITHGLSVPFIKSETGRWSCQTSLALNWWRDRLRGRVRHTVWRDRAKQGESEEE